MEVHKRVTALALILACALVLAGQSRVIQVRRSAGGGAPWAPSDLTLIGWWDCATGTTTDVDGINTLSDDSGNGQDLVQSTGSQKPSLEAAYKNGLDACLFDGVDDGLIRTAADWGAATSQPATVYIAFQEVGAPSGVDVFFASQSSSDLWNWKHQSSTFFAYAGGSNVGTYTGDTAAHYATIRYDGTSATVHVDGAAAGTGSIGTNALDGFTLGANWNRGNDMNTYIFEVFIATEGRSTDAETYLSDRWGI